MPIGQRVSAKPFTPHQGMICLHHKKLVYITDHRNDGPIGEWWTFFYVRKDGTLGASHGTKTPDFAPAPRDYEVRIVSKVPGQAEFAAE